MEKHAIVDSRFSAMINAPLAKIGIPSWCCSLPDEEYQRRSPAQLAADSTTARDGRRMSINAEVIGGPPIVRHHLEVVAEKHHRVLDSVTVIFTTAGSTPRLRHRSTGQTGMPGDRCCLPNESVYRDDFRHRSTPRYQRNKTWSGACYVT
jgi:hypothetical protein